MSYLVLARKYRPTTFHDIVGQEHIVRTLGNAIKLGRVHHAFLFTGARGVGKTTTARVMARALNCEQGPTLTPCGACGPCQDILSGASPDVFEIDGASNTGVDNVRELRESVRYLPQRGRFKLYIIDEVHMLSTAAFNALLKTLEEPPAHVKFIFATTEPHKIPVTILSRCQRFDFRRVSVPMLVEHLKGILKKENVAFSPAALTSIVREAQGSVRDALSLLDQVLSFAGESPDDQAVAQALGLVERQTVFDLCQAVLDKDATRLLTLVREVDARGHDLNDLATLLVEHLRDVMVAKVVPDPRESLLERSPDELVQLRAQAEKASRADLHRYFSVMTQVAEDTSRAQEPRLSLEMGLLRLLEIEPTASLTDLLQRLDRLASGSPQGPSTPPSPGPGPRQEPPRPSPPPSTAVRSEPAAPPPKPAAPPPSASPSPPAPSSTSSASVAAPSPAPSAPARASSPASQVREAPADETPNEAWLRLVERLKGQRPAMGALLHHARVLAFGPDGVELGFDAGTFFWESAKDAETKAFLTQGLREQFGQPVNLTLVQVTPRSDSAPASLAEVNADKRQRREEEIRQRAVSHPRVQEALEVLDGQVSEVKPLAKDLDDMA